MRIPSSSLCRRALAVLAFLCASLPAQEAGTASPVPVEAPVPAATVEVSARRPPPQPAPVAGRTVLGADDIAASGARSLADVLALVPGLSLSDSGGPGSQATVSLRGSSTNQVLILVDGAPASDPATGQADLSKLGLSAGDIESVEVIRGGASAQFGADAVGGVVSIKTKRVSASSLLLEASNLSRLPFSAVSGSGLSASEEAADPLSLADGQELALRLGLPGGIALSARGEREANAYRYVDANAIARRRENADLLGGSASLSWRDPSGALGASLSGSARSLGVPGSVSDPRAGARQEDGRVEASASYVSDAFLSDISSLSANLYGLACRSAYSSAPGAEAQVQLSSRAGLDARWSLLAAPWLSLGAGLSGRYERLDDVSVTTASGDAPQRLSAGAYLEPVLDFGAWRLAPAARYDWASDFPASLSLSLGLSRSLAEGLSASLDASTAYRAPSFDDLYWPAADGTEGNPGLKPESSVGGDLGLRYRDAGLSWSASLLCRYAKDVILWQPGTDGIWRPSNWGAALYPGAEASVDARLGELRAGFSYSYLRSYALSGDLSLADDRRLPMVPEHSFTASLSGSRDRLSWNAQASYLGLRYLKLSNTDALPSHLVLDAGLRLDLGGGSSLSLRGENLLDERYESIQGYPMPGFSLRATFSAALGGHKDSEVKE